MIVFRGRYKGSPELSAGHLPLFRMKQQIAEHVSADISKSYLAEYTDEDERLSQMKSVAAGCGVDEAVCEFLCSDSQGTFSPDKCRRLLAAIDGMESHELYGGRGSEPGSQMSIGGLKELLGACAKRGVPLTWQ